MKEMTQGMALLGRRRGLATAVGVALGATLAATLGATLLARYIRARPALLDHVRAFNRRHLNPRALRIAGRRGVYFHALRHVGRRSGRVYVTPLEAIPIGAAFVIPMTYGLRADWARNTLAAGGATLLRRGEALAVTRPRVVRLGEVSASLPLVERLGLRALGVGELLWVERADRSAQLSCSISSPAHARFWNVNSPRPLGAGRGRGRSPAIFRRSAWAGRRRPLDFGRRSWHTGRA